VNRDGDLPLVFHLITGLGVGGAERMLARTSARAERYRHTVCVLSDRGPVAEELAAAGIPVQALGLAGGFSVPAGLMKLRAAIASSGASILQSWLVHSNVAAALLGPGMLPLIWNVRHTLDGFERERQSTRWALRGSALLSRKPAKIIYNSHLAAAHHEAIGYPGDRTVVVPNGFELQDTGTDKVSRDRFRHSIGLADGDIAVGLIARVHPIKNHAGFLAAAARIVREHPRVKFVLAGAGTEATGALARKWHSKLAENAIWLGQRQDVSHVNASLDLAANVSFGEAFSNTLGEAMASGVPCIATNVGESAVLVGDTGWMCKSASTEDIEAALRDAIGTRAEERHRRGAAARVRIRERYSLHAAAQRYESVYDCVLKRPCV
jgi:glycosyltransferase involved in cell wall biosynthesis